MRLEGERVAHEALLSWRGEFPILERSVYLINNSLGAMPRGVRRELERYAAAWDERGVRAWHEGWWEMAVETGDLLAPILGVSPGEVTMHQNVSLATAVFLSALDYPGERNRIVYTDLDFPTLMYVLEGERRKGAEIVTVPSDDGISVPTERLLEAIDERTRLVPISHVLFRSGWLQDAERIAARCREVGALLLLDVYQSAGAVPIRLAEWGVDAAVGGSVKWLCGGPGAGYLWVAPHLLQTLEPTVTGWMADEEPFAFRAGPIRHAESAWRLLNGTPNIPALHACRPGYRILAEIGVERIRERSLGLTRTLIDAADVENLEVRTPREDAHRAGTVTLWHPAAERLSQQLLERDVLCDFRPDAGIRLAPHFYNSVEECTSAVSTLGELARAV